MPIIFLLIWLITIKAEYGKGETSVVYHKSINYIYVRAPNTFSETIW